MDWVQFNSAVYRTESASSIELDLHPFGAQQLEALEFWLQAALIQADPFGKPITIKMDASVTLSQHARQIVAELRQQHHVDISVTGQR
jgi:hypothetical protein